MGSITRPPTFLPTQPPIPFGAGNIGQVLTVLTASTLGFAGASGGGGGLPARYATAPAAGSYNNYNPGSGWPNSDTGARLIITPTGNVTLTGLLAGNDGELVLLWNNASLGAGYMITLENLDSASSPANQFTIAGSALVLPAQGRSLIVYDKTLGLWSVG